MSCVACGGAKRRFLYRWTSGFAVHRCEGCGLLYTDPRPTPQELTDYYTNLSRDEERHGHMRPYEDIDRLLPVIRDSLAHYLQIQGDANPRTFLDLGAGIGMYTSAAEALGLEAHYVEIDETAIAFARERLGLQNATRGDIQTLREHPRGPFDLVLSRHTIEHLLDPDAFVENLRSLVAPGGTLVLETPNAANWEQWAHPRIFGLYWSILGRHNPDFRWKRRGLTAIRKSLSAATPPKHLYGFNRENLTLLLARHGFRVRKTVITVLGDPVFDPLYHTGPGRQPKGAVARAYRLYERAVSPLVRRLRRGSLLIVFAERA